MNSTFLTVTIKDAYNGIGFYGFEYHIAYKGHYPIIYSILSKNVFEYNMFNSANYFGYIDYYMKEADYQCTFPGYEKLKEK